MQRKNRQQVQAWIRQAQRELKSWGIKHLPSSQKALCSYENWCKTHGRSVTDRDSFQLYWGFRSEATAGNFRHSASINQHSPACLDALLGKRRFPYVQDALDALRGVKHEEKEAVVEDTWSVVVEWFTKSEEWLVESPLAQWSYDNYGLERSYSPGRFLKKLLHFKCEGRLSEGFKSSEYGDKNIYHHLSVSYEEPGWRSNKTVSFNTKDRNSEIDSLLQDVAISLLNGRRPVGLMTYRFQPYVYNSRKTRARREYAS